MPVREEYFPRDSFTRGPFNLNALWFSGGTISGTEEEMHQLGQALLKAVATRESVKSGKWRVDVQKPRENWSEYTAIYDDWDVVLVFVDKMEWVIEWDEALSLATDYWESHLDKVEDGSRQEECFMLVDQLEAAVALDKDVEKRESLMRLVAEDVLRFCENNDIAVEEGDLLSEIAEEHCKIYSVSEVVSDWMACEALTGSGWQELFEDQALGQTVKEARQRLKKLELRVASQQKSDNVVAVAAV